MYPFTIRVNREGLKASFEDDGMQTYEVRMQPEIRGGVLYMNIGLKYPDSEYTQFESIALGLERTD